MIFEARRRELRSEPRPVQWGLGGAPRVVGSDGTVSIVKIVPLLVSKKKKSQEGNKNFVPELKKVVSVSDSYASEYFGRFSHIHISNMLHPLWSTELGQSSP